MNNRRLDDDDAIDGATNAALKPVIPPKPHLNDVQKRKLDNAEGDSNIDLDSLLLELCALENQLSSTSVNTNPASVLSDFSASSSMLNGSRGADSLFGTTTADSNSNTRDVVVNGRPTCHTSLDNTFVVLPNFASFSGPPATAASSFVKSESTTPTVNNCAGDEKTTDCRLNVATCSKALNQNDISPHKDSVNRTQSPDNDSAFCDSNSLASSESIFSSTNSNNIVNNTTNNNTNNGGSSCAKSVPSASNKKDGQQVKNPTLLSSFSHLNRPESAQPELDAQLKEKAKADKIKMALEKMKEANVKKIYVKIHYGPDSKLSKDIQIDERWTAGYVVKHLSQKFDDVASPFSINHSLVEICSDMHLERAYEDHEYLVENVSLWTHDSTNEIHFVERASKYDLFYNPQFYLLNDVKSDSYDSAEKQRLIMNYFSVPQIKLPEASGILYLKSDGKKSWKPFYFTLRLSGLYVCTKGPKSKSSKDLVCLSQLDNIQIYNAVGWKKKYKAPTEHGFALKHPKIQVKSSKYIKYLCAENEDSAKYWITAIRLAKHGKRLFDNFVECCEHMSEQDDGGGGRTLPNGQNRLPAHHQQQQTAVPSSETLSVLTLTHQTGLRGPAAAADRSPRNTFGGGGLMTSPRAQSASTAQRSTLRCALRSLDNLSTVSSSGCSMRDSESVTEVDSDEEDEATAASPSMIDVRSLRYGSRDLPRPSTVSVAGTAEDLYPPPPPPLCQQADEERRLPLLAQQLQRRPSSRGGDVDADAADTISIVSVVSTATSASCLGTSSWGCDTATVRRRKAPPAPPKRSETTRLSTVSMMSSCQSLNCSSSYSEPDWSPQTPIPATIGGNFTLSTTLSSAPLPAAPSLSAPKPPLPTKPKFLAANNNTATTVASQGGGNNVLTNDEATTKHGRKTSSPMQFQSELQLAMQKRLQKINDLEAAARES